MDSANKQTFTREQLYDLVWSQSLLSLSKQYSISDNGLRKLCIRMNIPLPRAGHWEKLKHGKKVTIAKLPSQYSGETEATLTLRTEEEKSSPPNETTVSKLMKRIQESISSQLVVPERLSSPDKLIVSARESLNRKEASYGLYRGVVSTSANELNIRVAPSNVSRALRIMDTFIKALCKRGHEIEVNSKDTYVVIDSQKIAISLKEKLKRVSIANERGYSYSEYQPTGILTLRIEDYTPTIWSDGKEALEQQLTKILARLELHAEKLKREHEEREKYWAQYREKERIAQELQKMKEKDLQDFKDMLRKASRWHKAVNLRNYIDEVEKRANENNSLTEETKQWLLWARQKADWYDPFTESNDEFLNGVDRSSF